jgi:hypothetical protein
MNYFLAKQAQKEAERCIACPILFSCFLGILLYRPPALAWILPYSLGIYYHSNDQIQRRRLSASAGTIC